MIVFVFLLVFVQSYSVELLYIDDLCPLDNNKTGICKFLSECDSAKYDLQVLRKQPGLCSFKYSTPIVCCTITRPVPVPITENPEIQTKPSIATSTQKQTEQTTGHVQIDNRLSISQKKCEEYSNYVYRNQSSPLLLPGIHYAIINSCNVQKDFKRGKVLPGEYPHLVSIGYSNINDPIYRCTGALISEEYILTTASCTTSRFGVAQVVRLGTTVKQETYFEYPAVQYIEVREFIKHPKYDPLIKNNDIALIRLTNPATINALTRPACLPKESQLNRTIAVGYASLSNYGEFQRDVKEDVLHLEQNKVCSRTSQRKKSNWCGRFESEQCVLDEGTPLQIINNSPYCTYTIVGLISSWEGCSSSKAVSVMDISKYVQWIESIVWM